MTTLNSKTIDIRPYRRARKYISIGNAIGKLVLKLKQVNMQRQAIRQLQTLTDAQLEDIGVPRHNIRQAVTGKKTEKPAVELVRRNQRNVRSISKDLGYEASPRRKVA